MFHLRFGLSDHLKALLDFVFGSRRRVKKVRIFRAWFSQYLGDTKSADDLAVFTKMAPERLCLGCGLRVDEPFAPIATGERNKTLLCCTEAPHICPARSQCTDTQ